MTPRVLGIDPGKHGGLALIHGPKAYAEQMPISGKELDVHELAVWIKGWEPDVAYVERVHAFPKQGVSSVFSFGKVYGIALGVLGALGIRTELVDPRTWKDVVLRDTTKDKDAMIAYCRRAYPGLSLVPPGKRTAHDGLADAIGIATYGKFREGGV